MALTRPPGVWRSVSGVLVSNFQEDSGMTVAQLIKQLQKMPKNAQVGVSHGDNMEYEVAGWVTHVHEYKKTDHQTVVNQLRSEFDRDAYDGHPAVWVTLHC